MTQSHTALSCLKTANARKLIYTREVFWCDLRRLKVWTRMRGVFGDFGEMGVNLSRLRRDRSKCE